LFLAVVGGYLLGVTSDRKLVMELQCNMALRWFVGLNLDEQPWDASPPAHTRAPGLLAPPICGAGLAILAGRPHNEA